MYSIPSAPTPPASKPTYDEIIAAYLHQVHSVNITPVSTSTGPSRATNALMGLAGGPLATGINAALTHQTKGAALQEWTTWKIFAIQKPDFQDFMKNHIQEFDALISDYDERLAIYREKMRSPEVIAAIKLKEKRDRESTVTFLGFIGLILATALLIIIIAG